jgi:pyruvate dehydrogenase E2 component (dihydrolipoamide acetyltransferase)
MGVFTMPSLGADMEAGTLAEWLVEPGDKVSRGQIVAVVETQKGAIEIEIFEEGTVAELSAEIGQKLPVGAPLARIVAEGEAPPTPEAPAEVPPDTGPEAPPRPVEAKPPAAPLTPVGPAPASGGIAASPAARVRARELGVDLSRLTGTGPGGAIVLRDVARPEGAGAEPATKSAAPPMAEMRRAIAAAMARSKQTIPHFYVSETIDIQGAVDWLAARNASSPPADRLLLGALFVRATALAALRVPALNGIFTDAAHVPSDAVNVGVAIALRGGGLVAPALLGADALDLDDTMRGMRDLVTRARAGRLRGTEMTAGTITVSSLGDGSGEAMAGVIFPPQVALVGIGSPRMRPWIVEGKVEARTVVTVTVSCDHRVSDGRQAAAFLAQFSESLGRPDQL